MKDFDTLWREVMKRNIVTVQEYHELEHVFNLLKDCESYLEVGTAEGNSLFVLGRALKDGANITCIDYGEKHTARARDEVIYQLTDEGHKVTAIYGDSNDFTTYKNVQDKKFDAVFIDAGHTDFNVAIDALFYGPLATRYIIFHDIMLQDVGKVFEWYCRQFPQRKHYRIVNSESYGMGVIVV